MATTHLLIVEDNIAHTELIRRAFEAESANIHLSITHTLRETRSYIAESTPDLMIIDLNLPDGKGIDLLHNAPEPLGFPVLVMTSFGDEQIAVEAMKAGVLDYIVKSDSTFTDMPRIVQRALREWEHISERKQAQEALRESERKFRSLVENGLAGIFMMNDQYAFTYVNAEMGALLGYETAELAQMRLLDLLAEESHPVAIDYFRRAQDEPAPIRCELTFLRKDGIVRQCEITVTAIRESGGSNSIGQLLDVTDRRQAEKQRLELALEKEKVDLMRVFVGNISHDLKTPLTTIQTGLYLLKRYTHPEQQRERLDLIQQQVHRLDKLIQDLLTISRLDYQPELSLRPININDLLYEIENQFLAQVEQKQLKVKLDLSANIPPIYADKDEMDRVFMNLIENAIHYTPEGRSIVIRTYTLADDVGIDVQDNGIGISPEDLPQIFDRFYRSDQARSQLSSGTGLGLAIVKKIVEMHDGSIQVHSQAGEGTTFRILLPIMRQQRP